MGDWNLAANPKEVSRIRRLLKKLQSTPWGEFIRCLVDAPHVIEQHPGVEVDYARRFCFDCLEFYMDWGDPALSDVTPATPPAAKCGQGCWMLDELIFTRAVFAQVIRQARTCPHFRQGPLIGG